MISYRKIRRNVKAISPVISVLMMIAVAVAASLVTYAWVMGYLNFTTAKVGKAIQIQSVSSSGLVYVQNVGDSQVTLSSLYINGTLNGAFTAPNNNLVAGATTNIQIMNGQNPASFVSGDKVTVKVTTTDGTFIEMTKAFP
jgi:flagellin-like protein